MSAFGEFDESRKSPTTTVLNEHQYVLERGYAAQKKDHEQTKWQVAKSNPLSVFWCLYGVFALITSSFDQNAALVVLGIPEFRKDFGYEFQGTYVIDPKWQAIFGGAPLAASALGAATAGVTGDKMGRRWTIIGGLGITFVGVALEFIATTVQMFFAGKFVNGFALGILIPTIVAYISEISPLALRGWMTGLSNFSFGLGSLVCYLVASSTVTRTDRWAYRGVFVAQWGFGGISLLIAPLMPESPWWLSTRGRDDDALKALQRLGYSTSSAEDHLAIMKVTKESAVVGESNGSSWLDCFKGTNLRRTIIAVMPVIVQGFVGLIFISGYATYYYQLAGISVEESFRYSCGSYGLSLGGNIIGVSVLDIIGRRPMLVWGTLALSAINFVAGSLATFPTNQSAVNGVVAMTLLWNFVCSVSLAAALFAMIPETPTTKLRIKTSGIVVIVQGSFFTMWSFVLPYMFNPNAGNLGGKTFLIFGVLSFLSFVYFFVYQTETANRSFEEIDEMFHKRVPARKFKGFVTDAQIRAQSAATTEAGEQKENMDRNGTSVHVEDQHESVPSSRE